MLELVPRAPSVETLPSPILPTSLRSSPIGWLWLSHMKQVLQAPPHRLVFLTQDKSLIRPCGMNTPRSHPRATGFLYFVGNGQLETGFIEENGARFVINTMTQGQGTIFPKGSTHFQANLLCEPLSCVTALNDEDPGANQITQRCKYMDWFSSRGFVSDDVDSFFQSIRSSNRCRLGDPWRYRCSRGC